MLITELEAVNGILRELGEQPLTSLDTSYPTVDLAKASLNSSRTELLQKGWWFNSILNYQVLPNAEGNFATPDNTLEFIPDNAQYFWSGKYVMNHEGETVLNVSYIQGQLKFILPFEALPWSAQELVVLMAAIKVYTIEYGPDQKYQEMMLRVRELNDVLAAQHVRAKRPNMAQRRSVRAYYSALRT